VEGDGGDNGGRNNVSRDNGDVHVGVCGVSGISGMPPSGKESGKDTTWQNSRNLIGRFRRPTLVPVCEIMIGQTAQSGKEGQNFSAKPKQKKSKTAFIGSRFRPVYSSTNDVCETRLSRKFEFRDMLSRLKTKKGDVHVNTAYKRKADKVRPVNSDQSTGEAPGGLPDWFEILWKRRMKYPKEMETDPPHRYDQYITSRFSRIARGSRLKPERIDRLKIGADLTPNEKEFLIEILYRREEALAWDFSEMSRIHPEVAPPQKIRTVPHEAWQAHSFPIPKGLTRTVIQMLEERLKSGVLERCDGPYRNPWFLVKKKSGKYRVVNAAMEMNKYTVRDANLPPNCDEFSEQCAGMAVATLMDWFSGYDQCTLHPESRDMTAFQTPLGLLRQTTLPMGATNSVAQFLRITLRILERNKKQAKSYFDDIVVLGPKTTYDNEEVLPGIRRFVFEHLVNLDRTLVSFEVAGARLSGEKSQWCHPGLVIVGYTCDYDGRRPEAAKVAKIVEWPPCANVTEARAFIGVCVYYRIWIKDFAIIAKPIFLLFRKNEPFAWTNLQVQAMETLKLALTTAPALKSIDYEKGAGEIIVGVDASGGGWGGILMQLERNGKRRHPIRYESGIWSATEKRYDAGKRECRAVLKMLKKCRGYLYGVPFVLEIDPSTLVAQLNTSARDLPGALVTQWLAWIRLFDFTVRHVPGTKHTAADGLSRRPRVEGEDENEEDIEDFIDAQLNCVRVGPIQAEDTLVSYLEPEYSPQHQLVAEYLMTLQRPSAIPKSEFQQFKKKALHYLIHGSHLFKQHGRNVPLRRVVDPPDERNKIIRDLHDESGHRGKNGTWVKVSQRYWWEGMYNDIKEYVESCEQCRKRSLDRRQEELHPTWVSTLWERVNIDAVRMPPNQRMKYLIIARDDLSGWPEAQALQKLTAKNVATFLYRYIITRFGCFQKLVSDGGPENKKQVIKLLKRYGIKRIVISPYNPQANGMIERGHQPIVDALSKLTGGFTRQGIEGWVSYLSSVLFADRTTIRTSTGMTPYRMLFGQEAVLPIELDVPTWQTLPWNTVRTRADLLAMRARQIERRNQDIEEARAHLQRMRIQGKEYYDRMKRLVKETPKVGDLVLLHDTEREKSYVPQDKKGYRWQGPYRVREVIPNKGSYFLEELDGTPMTDPIHGHRLKRFWLRDPRFNVNDEEDNGSDQDDHENNDDTQWIPQGEDFAVVI